MVFEGVTYVCDGSLDDCAALTNITKSFNLYSHITLIVVSLLVIILGARSIYNLYNINQKISFEIYPLGVGILMVYIDAFLY